ncbi:hypothetical protein [Paenirhodobacter enshiensis]|uniref:hypothetical protein n=1 Tax=Paenirhodobacter enshiensis TaxID=1105367 RepID=UPI003FA2320E
MTARYTLVALLSAAVLAGCVGSPGPAQSTPAGGTRNAPIVIRNDHGGNVAANILRREQLANSGREVQLRGFCDSACTMFTTLPNACLAPDATFGFHAPSIGGSSTPAPMVGDLIGQFYRNGIARKWQQSWGNSTKITRISAKRYVQLDPQARLCTR